jgi:hypothetical protein
MVKTEQVVSPSPPVSRKPSKVVLEMVPDPITRQQTLSVKHVQEAEEAESATSEPETPPDDPSKLVIELIQDPITRRPTIVIKPAMEAASQVEQTATTAADTTQNTVETVANEPVQMITKTITYTALQ